MAQTGAVRPHVGFVGIGNQGGPIAERIAAAGFPLSIWARRPEALAQFVAAGARAAGSVADLGACDIVGLCVLDDAAVSDVFDRLLPALTPGATVMILSTIHPDSCVSLAYRAAARGVALIDTPVSGGGAAARDGTLSVMVGGDAEALARCRPVIETFAGLIVHLGPIGSGQLAKLVNNTLLTANLALAIDALAVGEGLGIDRTALLTLIEASSGRSFATTILASLPSLGAFAGGAALLRKDVRLLGEAAAARDAPAGPLIAAALPFLDAVNADGRSQET